LPQIGTRRLALAAILATLYAVLRLIPVTSLVGINSTLTMAETFSPLVGMILGPFVGALSVFVGSFLVVVLGRPLVFDGLDFLPGVLAAMTAGLALRGKTYWVVALSAALILIYDVDPLSSPVIFVGGVPVPFLWMHILAAVTYFAAARIGGIGSRLHIVATVFVSTMNAHVAGSIMFENVLVRVNHALSPSALAGTWNFVFYLYPIERVFFTVVGAIIALAVLRAVPKERLQQLRG